MLLWVEAHLPVVRIKATGDRPVSMRAAVELWRTERRALEGQERQGVYGLNKSPTPVIRFPDTVVPDRPGQVVWYHRNETSIWPLTMKHQGLESLLARKYGSLDVFRERMREDMIITRNIENNVYAGETDPRARQEKLQAWYVELQNNTEVIIYDPRLKALAQSGSGCACCNS